ncbi:unnamed protein product [Cylindrotheca closterium]|uniref:Uncharacterized protein n=1 Tax=Cylindrotheca closterium TaxID=2856 RepID=A0AAD2FX76_9STRA|nr:unnamed protein product [Cylindrotheca closterium]
MQNTPAASFCSLDADLRIPSNANDEALDRFFSSFLPQTAALTSSLALSSTAAPTNSDLVAILDEALEITQSTLDEMNTHFRLDQQDAVPSQ